MSIFQKFTIDSTVEFVSDHFTLSFEGSAPFRNKTATDVVTLRAGLKTSLGVSQFITKLENGPTDEFEITIRPNGISGVKNGRDGIAKALDSFFEKRYYRWPEVVPPYPPIDPDTHQPIPQVDSTGTALPNPPPGVSGTFTAAQVVSDACASVGVAVSWEIPDYQLLTSYFATGRVIDTIQQLVQPYTLTTPFKADIYSNGTVLVIRQRNPFRAPDFTIAMVDAKRNDLILRVRKTQKYGQVWLTGAPNALATNPFGVWVEGEEEITSSDETQGPDGTILSRVNTTEIKITPTGQTKSKVTETYTRQFVQDSFQSRDDLVLTNRTTETNLYTIGSFGIVGPIAPKILVSCTIVTEGFDDDGNWTTLRTQERGVSYDHGTAGFQTSESFMTRELQDTASGKQLVPTEMTIKTTRDCGYLQVEQITEKYQFQDVTSGGQTSNQPVLLDRDIQRQGGFRVGGPAALPRTIGNKSGEQIRLVRTVSTDADAVKVVQNLPNMDISALQVIMSYFQSASGMWEYELSMSGANMPWISRGMYLQLTDIQSEVPGTLIALPVMLVTEADIEYDESVQGAKSISKIRAFGWSNT